MYKPPRNGQTVRLTFEGVVTDTDLHNVRLRTDKHTGGAAARGVSVSWGSGIVPEVTVLKENYAHGTVGLHTASDGTNTLVVFTEENPGTGQLKGWHSIPYNKYTCHADHHSVLPLLNPDGTPFEH